MPKGRGFTAHSVNVLIHMGRAKDNGLGHAPRNWDVDNEISIEDGMIDTLYVSAKGECVFNCNLPYSDIDEDGIPLEQVFAEIAG